VAGAGAPADRGGAGDPGGAEPEGRAAGAAADDERLECGDHPDGGGSAGGGDGARDAGAGGGAQAGRSNAVLRRVARLPGGRLPVRTRRRGEDGGAIHGGRPPRCGGRGVDGELPRGGAAQARSPRAAALRLHAPPAQGRPAEPGDAHGERGDAAGGGGQGRAVLPGAGMQAAAVAGSASPEAVGAGRPASGEEPDLPLLVASPAGARGEARDHPRLLRRPGVHGPRRLDPGRHRRGDGGHAVVVAAEVGRREGRLRRWRRPDRGRLRPRLCRDPTRRATLHVGHRSPLGSARAEGALPGGRGPFEPAARFPPRGAECPRDPGGRARVRPRRCPHDPAGSRTPPYRAPAPAPAADSFNSSRAITRRWISDVPSPIVHSFTSRKNFSTGKSLV